MTLDEAKEALTHVQAGCTRRLATPDMFDDALTLLQEARTAAEELGVDPDAARAEVDSGAVLFSYKNAKTTRIVASFSNGEPSFKVSREFARRGGREDEMDGRRLRLVPAPKLSAAACEEQFGLTGCRKYRGELRW